MIAAACVRTESQISHSYDKRERDREREQKVDQGGGEGKKNILIFGKPLVGKPMAAEHINALAITRRFG